MGKGSAKTKWLAGVASTVVAGLIIWFLTDPDGLSNLINPDDPPPAVKKPRPNLVLLDYSIRVNGKTRRTVKVGEPVEFVFLVANDGDATAESARIRLDQMDTGGSDTSCEAATSFGLMAGEKQTLRYTWTYRRPGHYKAKAYVSWTTTWGSDSSSSKYGNINVTK